MTSNRQKKRIVSEGLKDLLSRPGWDPRRFKSGMTGIDGDSIAKEAVVHESAETAYQESDTCPDCVAVRLESGDETALCEKHMRQAMGFR